MAVFLSVAEKVNRANALNTDIGGSAVLKIYTGAVPSLVNGDLAPSTGTLLVSLTCSPSTFGTVSTSGAGAVQLTANTIPQVNAITSGVAGFARLFNAIGSPIMDMDLTDTNGFGALQLNTTNIVAGGAIIIGSFVINEG